MSSKKNSHDKKDSNNLNLTVSDTDILAQLANKCDESINHFNTYLSKIVPNVMDLDKIKNIVYHNGATIKDLLANQIILVRTSNISAQIEITDHKTVQAHMSQIQKAIQLNGYLTSEGDTKEIIVIKLKQVTEDARKAMIHEIKGEYEKHKATINHNRSIANKTAKNMTEDLQKRCEKKIDDCKNKYVEKLDKMYHDKARSICPNTKL